MYIVVDMNTRSLGIMDPSIDRKSVNTEAHYNDKA